MTRKWTKCEHITLHDFIKISIKNGMFFVLLILQSLFTEFYFLKINYVQYSRVLNLIWVNNSTFCISCHLCLIHVTSIYLSLFFTEFVSHFKLKDIDLFRSHESLGWSTVSQLVFFRRCVFVRNLNCKIYNLTTPGFTWRDQICKKCQFFKKTFSIPTHVKKNWMHGYNVNEAPPPSPLFSWINVFKYQIIEVEVTVRGSQIWVRV